MERGKEAPRVRQARELTSLIDALDKTDRAVEVGFAHIYFVRGHIGFEHICFMRGHMGLVHTCFPLLYIYGRRAS